MSNIRKGDNVVVITGSEQGQEGLGAQGVPKENRALVQGVNVVSAISAKTQTQQPDP